MHHNDWNLSAGGKVLNNSLSVNSLLSKESSSSKHSKTSILKLLGLHDIKLLRIFGHKSKGIESEVTGSIVILKKTGLVNGTVSGVYPSLLCTLSLISSNEGNDNRPESIRYLGDVGNSRSGDLSVKEERGSLYLLSDKESNNGKHSNTSVSKLSLTVTSKSSIGGLLSKFERIEDSYRGKSSRDSIKRCRESRRRGLGSNLGRGESSSRGDKESRNGDLHCDYYCRKNW
jgi:hypothetical protein